MGGSNAKELRDAHRNQCDGKATQNSKPADLTALPLCAPERRNCQSRTIQDAIDNTRTTRAILEIRRAARIGWNTRHQHAHMALSLFPSRQGQLLGGLGLPKDATPAQYRACDLEPSRRRALAYLGGNA